MFDRNDTFRTRPRLFDMNAKWFTDTHDGPLSKVSWPVRFDVQKYERDTRRPELLTAEAENELGWSIINDNCQASRERLARANLRLVVVISKNYTMRGLSLADLIEEGNTGLHCAIEAFDPALGVRFSTYASWWIKQTIKHAILNANRPVKLPA